MAIKADYRRYNIVTYNHDIKYAFIDYLHDNNFVLVSVSGYYYDGRGREGYYIEFEIPANADIGAIDAAIDELYDKYGE